MNLKGATAIGRFLEQLLNEPVPDTSVYRWTELKRIPVGKLGNDFIALKRRLRTGKGKAAAGEG